MAGVLSLGRITLDYVASYLRERASMSDFPKASGR